MSGWHATARALAAREDCPKRLVLHVVSEAVKQRQCVACGEPWLRPQAYCQKCSRRPPRTVVVKAADAIPDLTSDANGGALLVALGKLCVAPGDEPRPGEKWLTLDVHNPGWRWEVAVIEREETAEGYSESTIADTAAEHLAHAAALALLAVRP
jgi:hypothetical protein